jgi:hypothetical protein
MRNETLVNHPDHTEAILNAKVGPPGFEPGSQDPQS